MPDLIVRLGPFVISTFTLSLALGAGATFVLLWGQTRSSLRMGQIADVCLGALIGAAVGGRLAHVALNWSYFSAHASEITRLSAGGIDWHGALIGGLPGCLAAARWRRVPFSLVLDSLAPALPLLMVASWYGCLAATCGYGLEVDTLARYPSWAVAETPDVYGIAAPRYNTQVFGIVLAALTLLIALGLTRIRALRGSRFWVVLALLSAEMFGIGFARGDFALSAGGLRVDQWLDLGLIALSVVAIAGQVMSGIRGTASRMTHPAGG